MNENLTEEELIKLLKDPDVSVDPDRRFFDENYTETTPPLSDDPSDEERWDRADNVSYLVRLSESVPRMEIRITNRYKYLSSVYQDAMDGDIYPVEEGGESYSDDIRTMMIEQDAAFDGCLEDPASIVAFVEDVPPSEITVDVESERDTNEEV